MEKGSKATRGGCQKEQQSHRGAEQPPAVQTDTEATSDNLIKRIERAERGEKLKECGVPSADAEVQQHAEEQPSDKQQPEHSKDEADQDSEEQDGDDGECHCIHVKLLGYDVRELRHELKSMEDWCRGVNRIVHARINDARIEFGERVKHCNETLRPLKQLPELVQQHHEQRETDIGELRSLCSSLQQQCAALAEENGKLRAEMRRQPSAVTAEQCQAAAVGQHGSQPAEAMQRQSVFGRLAAVAVTPAAVTAQTGLQDAAAAAGRQVRENAAKRVNRDRSRTRPREVERQRSRSRSRDRRTTATRSPTPKRVKDMRGSAAASRTPSDDSSTHERARASGAVNAAGKTGAAASTAAVTQQVQSVSGGAAAANTVPAQTTSAGAHADDDAGLQLRQLQQALEQQQQTAQQQSRQMWAVLNALQNTQQGPIVFPAGDRGGHQHQNWRGQQSHPPHGQPPPYGQEQYPPRGRVRGRWEEPRGRQQRGPSGQYGGPSEYDRQ